MRRIFFLPLALLALISFMPTTSVNAQTFDLFCEDFDSLGVDSFYMARSQNPVSGKAVFFRKDSVVTKNFSSFSAVDTTSHRKTSYLTSPWVTISGFDNVGVSFDQICYIEWFDEAIVEYTFDGTNWARLPYEINNSGSLERVYTGASLYQRPQLAFSKLSNPIIWPFNDSMFIFTRNTTAWVKESFNVTPVINRETRNNNGVAPDSMQIRLGLYDNPASPLGKAGPEHKWWIDNFCIRGSNCELTPPNLVLDDPPANYPTRYDNRVYWVGPYIFNAQITDASQINRAYIEYYVKRDIGSPVGTLSVLTRDTVDFNFLGFSRYEGWIPRAFTNDSTGLLDSIRPGDSVYWKVEAVDNSPCFNTTQDPPAGFTSFQVRGNLPKACGTQPIFNFPHYQTFNGVDFLPGESGVLAESWINAEGDFHDWYVWQDSAIDYPNTGPSGDLPGGGKYLLLEATGFRDSTAYLLSPCIDLFESPNNLIRFYLNQNGVGGDTVNFDIFDPTPIAGFPDGRFLNDRLPPIGGNKGDVWLPYEINTYPYRGKVIQLRWRGTPASASENTDIGLDSFKIVPAPVQDLRLDRVELGPYIPHIPFPGANREPAIVRVANLGALPADSFAISYRVIPQNGTPGAIQGPFIYVQRIEAGENIQFILDDNPADLYTVPLGEYSIEAWVDYHLDETSANDTAVANTTGVFYKQADCSKEYFDDVNYWLGLANDSTTFSNKWELGTPEFGRTNSAYTEPNSWDVLLDRGYAGSGGVEQLITQFYDTRGMDSVIMAFMNNRAMENTKDGVFIEYSLDRGLSWSYLDNLDDTVQAKHWYNSFLSSGGFGGQFVLSDTTRNEFNNWNNWLETEIMLPDTLEDKAEVLFRFIFFAEEEPGGSAGMSIDNFLLYDQSGIDLDAHRIVRPIDKCDLPTQQPFMVVVKNRGNAPVSTFDITYMVNDGPIPNQSATETINRTIMPRDTIHIVSSSKFDFSLFGYYDISFAVTTQNDICSANDTLRGQVENIDGCSFVFQAVTGNFIHRSFVDSSAWRFDITNGNDKYVITDDYRSLNPADTNRRDICIKNGSSVRFFLDDRDTVITTYSFIAFDGNKDTVFVDQELGGASPPKYFDWNCPPERSAKLLDIIMTNDYFLPVEGDYKFRVRYQNNGLDSINFVEVGLKIDDDIYRINDVINPPNPEGLKYTRRRLIEFPPAKKLKPGTHEITAWVHDPNGLPDLLPIDDTLKKVFTVIDTSVFSTISEVDDNGNVILAGLKYCTTFEDTAKVKWAAYNPYPDTANISRTQDTSQLFVRAVPNKATINMAKSGTKAWITGDTGNYGNIDSTALLSPFFRLSLDSCYKVSFWNNYLIRDKFNDGGHFQISGDLGVSWKTIFYGERDSVNLDDTTISPLTGVYQNNWHNAKHIKAIPDNSNNSGWTGSSGGWVLSENIFGGTQPIEVPADGGRHGLNPFRDSISVRGGDTTYYYPEIELIGNTKEYFAVFRFRFESDATITDEGWAIDDFCLETINAGHCFAVGLDEELALRSESEVYIGQNIPNPANGTTSIPYVLPNSASMSVRVVNVMGQEMYYNSMSRAKGSGYIDLDISNYAQGIYYYTIDVDGIPFTKKMIVTK